MSNLGVAAIQPGIAALTIGTSGAIRVMTNQPIVDEKMRTFTYALDETHWVVGGATNSGASVPAWLKEKIFDDGNYFGYHDTNGGKHLSGERRLDFSSLPRW